MDEAPRGPRIAHIDCPERLARPTHRAPGRRSLRTFPAATLEVVPRYRAGAIPGFPNVASVFLSSIVRSDAYLQRPCQFKCAIKRSSP